MSPRISPKSLLTAGTVNLQNTDFPDAQTHSDLEEIQDQLDHANGDLDSILGETGDNGTLLDEIKTQQTDKSQQTQITDGTNTLGTPTHPVKTDPTGSTAQPITDNGGSITVDGTVSVVQSGTWNVNATVTDGSGPITVDGTVAVSNFPATQPISTSSLPLPTGASTATKQDTGNTSLSSIDGKIVTVNTGAVVVSSSSLPAGAAQDSSLTTANTKLDTLHADNVTIEGKLDTSNTNTAGIRTDLGTDGTSPPALGGGSTGVRGFLRTILDKLNSTLAVTQSGTWTVQPGNTANTTAWKVDGSAVTQPVSATSLTDATQKSQIVDSGGTNIGTTGNPIRVSTAGTGALSVSQNGTWTVQPGNTQNTTPWYVEHRNSYNHISTATTTTVKSGAGMLRGIAINNRGVGGTITVYDSTTGSGTVIAVIDPTANVVTLVYDLVFSTGLTVVTTGATPADITVMYR